jgi:hypothetical protein
MNGNSERGIMGHVAPHLDGRKCVKEIELHQENYGSGVNSTIKTAIGDVLANSRNQTEAAADDHGIAKIDFKSLRLTSAFTGMDEKKVITHLNVGKPLRETYFRIHPEPEYRATMMALELKETREIYLLTHDVWSEIGDMVRPITFYPGIDHNKNVFILPVPAPANDGRRCSWHQSLAAIVVNAMTHWGRMSSNTRYGTYDFFIAGVQPPEPEWPEESFDELLEIAFRDRVITTADDRVLQRLQGLAWK